jgi:hypothetical protein
MLALDLPADLLAFLQAGRRLEYDPAACWAGRVALTPLHRLEARLFPMDCQSTPVEERDPHFREYGCYMVPGVDLIAACEGYEPTGLLLWLPGEGRYGSWDSHGCIWLLPEGVTWSDIAEAPARHINPLCEGSGRMECLVPWPKYPYSEKQLYDPQPAEPDAAPDRPRD